VILTLIGAGISIVLSLFGWWLKWKLNQASKDRRRAEEAEKTAQDLREGLKSSYETNAAHEKAVVEILNPDLSDERASELLASSPKASPVSGAASAGNGNGRNQKVP